MLIFKNSSVYIADSMKMTADGPGGVFRIPAGSDAAHTMELVHYVPHVHGIAYAKFIHSTTGVVGTFLQAMR